MTTTRRLAHVSMPRIPGRESVELRSISHRSRATHHSAEGSPELAPLLSKSPLSFNSPTTSSPLPSQTAAPIGDRPARPPSRFFLGRPLSSLRYPLFSPRLFLRLQSCDSRQSTSSTAWATDQTTSIPDLVHPPSGPTPLFAIPSPAETLVSSFSLALTNQAR